MKKNISDKELLQKIVEGIQERKGKRIVSIDLTGIDGVLYDYFVICEGDSNTHVSSIAESVEDYLIDEVRVKPLASDGFENAQWIVFDYGNIMVHIFQREARNFYSLETLWSDAKITEIPDLD